MAVASTILIVYLGMAISTCILSGYQRLLSHIDEYERIDDIDIH